MVTTVDDILEIVRSNPFIDGVGYFIEVTTSKPVPERDLTKLNQKIRHHFCAHAHATLDGEDVLGLDFHEHIFTQGDGSDDALNGLAEILHHIEHTYGVDHLCIEFQFDLSRARDTRKHIDQLLKP